MIKSNCSFFETKPKFSSKNTPLSRLSHSEPKTKMKKSEINSRILSFWRRPYPSVRFTCPWIRQYTWFRTSRLWSIFLQPQSALRLWVTFQSKTWFAKILSSELMRFIFLLPMKSKNRSISLTTSALTNGSFIRSKKSSFPKV